MRLVKKLLSLLVVLVSIWIPGKVLANIPADANLFVFTVDASVSEVSAVGSFQLPVPNTNYQLYWEEIGNEASNNSAGAVQVSTVNHVINFGSSGSYRIGIDPINVATGTNNFDRFAFSGGGDKSKLLTIEQWGTSQWSSMYGAFYGASNFSDISASDSPDLSAVVNMQSMFHGATVFNGSLANWDVSGVTTMQQMFSGASSFNQDISGWEADSLTSAYLMFYGAESFNSDMPNFAKSSLANAQSMFHGATAFNGSLANWDVSGVTNMGQMFFGSGLTIANYDSLLSSWNAQAVQNDVPFSAGTTNFCRSSAEHASLVNNHGWVITDAGLDCTVFILEEVLEDSASLGGGGNSNSTPVTVLELSDITGIENVIAANELAYQEAIASKTDFSNPPTVAQVQAVIDAVNNNDAPAFSNGLDPAFVADMSLVGATNGPISVATTDVDGDGDLDFLSASYISDAIAWYENDGAQQFTTHIITTTEDYAYAVTTADLDGDGDSDALSASYQGNNITWYENDGAGNFTQHIISSTAVSALSVAAADVDGDGDLDVVSGMYSGGTIVWYENDGAQNFTEHSLVGIGNGVYSVDPSDIDGDGDTDILSTSLTGDSVVWLENDGNENFTVHIISSVMDGARWAEAADVDGDGDLDVVSASFYGDTLDWHENDGSENFTTHSISVGDDGEAFITSRDIDADGDIDLVSTSYYGNNVVWHENDGNQSFTAHNISSNLNGPVSVAIDDLNDDGQLDMLVASGSDNAVTLYRNESNTLDGNPTYIEDGNSVVFDSDVVVFDEELSRNGSFNGASLTLERMNGANDDDQYEAVESGTLDSLVEGGSLTVSGTVIGTVTTNSAGILVLNFSAAATNALVNEAIQQIAYKNKSNTPPADTQIVWEFDDGGDVVLSQGDPGALTVTGSITVNLTPANDAPTGTISVDNINPVEGSYLSASNNIADRDGLGEISYRWLRGTDEIVGAAGATYTVTQADVGYSISVQANYTDGQGTAESIDSEMTAAVLSLSESAIISIAKLSASIGGQNSPSAIGTSSVSAGNSCVHIKEHYPNASDGIYWIDPDDDETDFSPAKVFCDMTSNGGGWTYIVNPVHEELGEKIPFGNLDLTRTAGGCTRSSIAFLNNGEWYSHRGHCSAGGATNKQYTWSWENTLSATEVRYSAGTSRYGSLKLNGTNIPPNSAQDANNYDGNTTVDCNTNACIDYDHPRTDYFNGDLVFVASATHMLGWGGRFSIDRVSVRERRPNITNISEELSAISGVVGVDPDNEIAYQEALVVETGFSNLPSVAEIQSFVDSVNLHVAALQSVLEDSSSNAGANNSDGVAISLQELNSIDGLTNVTSANEMLYQNAIAAATRFSNPPTVVEVQAVIDVANNNDAPTFDILVTPLFAEHTISTDADYASSVETADLDGDGDLDVLSASINDNKIAWYENNGNEDFTTHLVSTAAIAPFAVVTADVDSDGDLDVLSASRDDDKIAWYENDGSQNFTAHTITTAANYAASVTTADLDGDGDLDVLSASRDDDKIAWYENDGTENFTAHTITTTADSALYVVTADVDNDGDIDVLSASSVEGKVAWYENDGSQSFTAHIISTSADGARSVTTADVDGDGDLDVLSASLYDDKIAWYENDGSENFTAHTISTDADYPIIVKAADVDDDGDIDVLSASRFDSKIAWYENDGNENFTSRTITTNAGSAYSVATADLDADGDLDVLSASLDDDKIAWYENDGGTFNSLDGSPSFTESGDSVVLDSDVSIFDDELSGRDNFNGATLVLIRNGGSNADDQFSSNGTGTLGSISEGSDVVVGTTLVGLVTTNSAGVLAISFDANATNSLVNETLQQITYRNSSKTPPASVLIDWVFDDGGDIIAPQGSSGALQSAGSTAVTITLVNDSPVGIVSIDNTSPVVGNILTATNTLSDDDGLGEISYQWKRGGVNIEDATGTTYSTTEVDAGYQIQVVASFVDGQGAAESVTSLPTSVVLSLSESALLAVLEDSASGGGANNSDGSIITLAQLLEISGIVNVDVNNEAGYQAAIAAENNFSTPPALNQVQSVIDAVNNNDAPTFHESVTPGFNTHTISTAADGALWVTAADLDGDGDMDAVAASRDGGTIDWYENDGSQNFTVHVISNSRPAAYSVATADLDDDGDMDVLSASREDDTVAWYENDGSENFIEHTITTSADGANYVVTADVDGDGDLDVLSASNLDDTVAWYENDGNENFVIHTITTEVDNARLVITADVDGDGDLDVVSASRVDDTISWYENDGNQNYAAHLITTSADYPFSVVVEDLDQDGDLDFLSASIDDDKVAWYENDGSENFVAHTITTDSNGAVSVSVADVDNDGDLDVVSASYLDDTVVWHENDGSENFTTHTILTTADGVRTITTADMDGDGDIDVLSASLDSDTIAWYENDGGRFNTLNGSPTYVEGSDSVVLDSDVVITDDELSAVDNFSGATLVLMRNGGENVDDQFSSVDGGSLGALTESTNLTINEFIVGLVATNSSGLLSVSFNGDATNASVNEVLQNITYKNNSNAPPASVQIDWVFDDGGNDVIYQGNPGALQVAGSTTVTITAVNDVPTGMVSIDNAAPIEGDLLSVSNSLSDADGIGAISYQWQRGGVDIVGATGSSYSVTLADSGFEIQVVASFTDAQGSVESVSSVATAIVLSLSQAALIEVLEDSSSTGGGNNDNDVVVTVGVLANINGIADLLVENEALYQQAISVETGFTDPPTLAQVQAIIDKVNAGEEALAEVLEDSQSIGGASNVNEVAVTATRLAAIPAIDGVVALYESQYQAAIQAEEEFSNPPTVVQIQAIINRVNASEEALAEVLEDSVSTGGAGNANLLQVTAVQLASITDLVSVDAANEAQYQAAIAAETGFDSPVTLSKLQSLILDVNSAAVLAEVLEDSASVGGANNDNSMAVSVEQLGKIVGITSVDALNEVLYQTSIAAETEFSEPPSLSEVQVIIDSVNSNVQALTEVLEDSSSTGGASNANDSLVSIEQLAAISGITNLVTANETAYQSEIRIQEGFSNLPTLAEVQAIITAVNTNETLAMVLAQSSSVGGLGANFSRPLITTADLTLITELEFVLPSHEQLYQQAISAETGFSNPATLAQLQALVNQVNAQFISHEAALLEVLEDSNSTGGSNNENGQTITIAQLNAIPELVNIVLANEPAYQVAIARETDFSNPPGTGQIQRLIDAVNISESALGVVLAQSSSVGSSGSTADAELVTTDLLASITGLVRLEPSNELAYQQAIALETGFSNLPTRIQLQALIDAVNTSESVKGLVLAESSTAGGTSGGNISVLQLSSVIGLTGINPTNEAAYQSAIASEASFSNPPTIVQLQALIDSQNDADGDGISDALEQGVDTDNDGIPDNLDADSDNDSISDLIEGSQDTDNDGVPDFRDLDTDNDGISDIIESVQSGESIVSVDQDLDGRVDSQQQVGVNGLIDLMESGIDSGVLINDLSDTDGDGVPDHRDLDSDNDGVLDVAEAGFVDADNDGMVDQASNQTSSTRSLSSVTQLDDGLVGLGGSMPPDSDDDGIADFRDLDSDNDGLMDIAESFLMPMDSDGDGRWDDFIDENGNGVSENFERAPSAALDTDDDGLPNFVDLDSDSDGLSDLIESGGEDSDMNGAVDDLLDRDGDGVDDGIKMIPMVAIDTDGDGTPNYQDSDSDNDGLSDLEETGGMDVDGDGRADQLTLGAALPDVDGNGVPNHLQSGAELYVRVGVGGGGAAGCSIASASSKADPLLPILGMFAVSWLALRRRCASDRSITRVKSSGLIN